MPTTFKAVARTKTGTGQSRAARKTGTIPAVIYGPGVTPLHVNVNAKEVGLSLDKNFKKTVFDLELDGKKLKVLPRDVQFHKVTDNIQHLDLILVTEKTTVKVFVPIEYINHAKSPGLKRGGVLNIVRRDVQLFCTPGAIPEKIEVDLAGTEIGHATHINDIPLTGGAKPVEKRNFTLVTIVGKSADEPTPVASADSAAVAAAAAAPAAGAAKAPAAAAKAPAGKK